MRPLRLADLDQARQARWRSALLLLTDRCPVGCAHCSVDARPDHPGIRDWALFEQVLDALCANPRFQVVGVTGGEPFVEPRGLALAAQRIHAAGKDLVVYTSGLWGTRPRPPAWLRRVLDRCSCVVLSTDRYHAERLTDIAFIGAARAVVAQGSWLIVQVIDERPERAAATDLLRTALGAHWSRYAELHPVPLLPYGRGARLAGRPGTTEGREFGRCGLVDAPVVRYDGRLAGCCNEQVIRGAGPARLHRAAASRQGVADALEELRVDPLLRLLGRAGVGPLTALPGLTDLATGTFRGICEACWRVLARRDERTAVAVRLLADVATGTGEGA
jgi:hypothetical protein